MVAAVLVCFQTAAQTESLPTGPAELPPPSFDKVEYVDSRGCAFTRAAIDGSVTWVPRVNAARQQICKQSPSVPVARSAASGSATRQAPVPRTAAAARAIPRHVYDQRQNTLIHFVPSGYRSVWDDGRLNPNRAEMTLAPNVVRSQARAPRGFVPAWNDGRLNPNRGRVTSYGESQTDQIWTRTIPRTLRPVPTDAPVVDTTAPWQQKTSPFWTTGSQSGSGQVTRLSTRSGPVAFKPRADR